jgi:hypothetical protein
MFTKRFFKLFMALGLAAVIALTVRGVVATANNAAAAQTRSEQYAKPAQDKLNVLTGQAAAEAWLEKYGKPVKPDFNVLTGQAAAEAWVEQYARSAKDDSNLSEEPLRGIRDLTQSFATPGSMILPAFTRK